MSRFKKDGSKELPAISTASLPDIVFMLLFFFMVSTSMRDVTVNVDIETPKATEITKMMKTTPISYIYIGQPKDSYKEAYGTAPRIQLNDQFSKMEDVGAYLDSERESISGGDDAKTAFTTALKVDEDTRMGIVTDVKQEMRKVSALRILYSARKKVTE
ncbi:MAG: ExbD/TolR family protein [Bacteroidales bacterium]